MKLAEALQERADLNRKIEELNVRLKNNCLMQEGKKPEEDPDKLLQELDGCIQRLHILIAGINKINCETKIDGKTLTEMIAEKDCLNIKLSSYKAIINEASQKAKRAAYTEIKILSSIQVSKLQDEVDKISKQIRLLDNKLQECNWNTTFLE